MRRLLSLLLSDEGKVCIVIIGFVIFDTILHFPPCKYSILKSSDRYVSDFEVLSSKSSFGNDLNLTGCGSLINTV